MMAVAQAAGAGASAGRVLNVSKLSFLPALSPPASAVTGRVSGLAGNSFRLPGVTVNLADRTRYSGGIRIGLQKVDASEATLVEGSEADLANGRKVEGVCSLAGPEGGRYVELSRLRFLK